MLYRRGTGIVGDWAWAIPLGHPSRASLLEGLEELNALIVTLRGWERDYGTSTSYQMRQASGPKQVPTHVRVPSIEVAARLATPRKGESWDRVLRRTWQRASLLSTQMPRLDSERNARVLRMLDACDDLEFELVLATGSWFSSHDARGLTYRQAPIPGIDSKWLENKRRQDVLCLLSGKEELGLVGWAPMIEFAYNPTTVVIVENKDTYCCFPELRDAVCVFGSGFLGVSAVGRLPWVRAAAELFYWGDVDADGFEILNAYRASGLACKNIIFLGLES